jgi:hypothetical protein
MLWMNACEQKTLIKAQEARNKKQVSDCGLQAKAVGYNAIFSCVI